MAMYARWTESREAIDLALLGAQSMLLNATDSCNDVVELFQNATPRWIKLPILSRVNRLTHIPKTGGTTVENFLGWTFSGHANYTENQGRMPRRGAPFLTVLRHPLERSLSAYFFIKAGRHMKENIVKMRQTLFCRAGTGRYQNVTQPCVPKLPPYEWMRCHADPNRAAVPLCASAFDRSSDGPQYQFEYLKPTPNATLPSVVRLLSERFFLVGATEQLPTLLPLAARALGRTPQGNSFGNESSNLSAKVTPHPSVAELFTEAQYRQLAEQRRVDLTLYAWARTRLERLAICLDVSVVYSDHK